MKSKKNTYKKEEKERTTQKHFAYIMNKWHAFMVLVIIVTIFWHNEQNVATFSADTYAAVCLVTRIRSLQCASYAVGKFVSTRAGH